MPKLSEHDLSGLSDVEKKIYEDYIGSDMFQKISFEAYLHRTAISILMKRSDEAEEKIKDINETIDDLTKVLKHFDGAIDQLKNNSNALVRVLQAKNILQKIDETNDTVIFRVNTDD